MVFNSHDILKGSVCQYNFNVTVTYKHITIMIMLSDAVRSNPGHADAPFEVVKQRVMNWLRTADDREGGRRRRREAKLHKAETAISKLQRKCQTYKKQLQSTQSEIKDTDDESSTIDDSSLTADDSSLSRANSSLSVRMSSVSRDNSSVSVQNASMDGGVFTQRTP